MRNVTYRQYTDMKKAREAQKKINGTGTDREDMESALRLCIALYEDKNEQSRRTARLYHRLWFQWNNLYLAIYEPQPEHKEQENTA